MKKSLLVVVISVISIVANAQIIPSPSWSVQNTCFPIVSAGIRYMDAISPNVVWAIGYDGTVANPNTNMFTRTINGGATYTSGTVWTNTLTYAPASIEGIDANTAWVSAYLQATSDKGAVFKTTDGGVTWINMNSASMFTVAGVSFVDFVAFTSASVGIALGDPAPTNKFEIYRTIDGGASWSQIPGAAIPNANAGEYGLTDVYTHVANHLWFGTNQNRIYHSADAGQTWSVSATITGTVTILNTSGIRDIAFRDPSNGLALMSAAGTNYLYNTNDGGATWNQITPIDPNMGLNDLCAVPGTTAYASCGAGVGNNIISYSGDDGVTWNSWGGSNVQYLQIDFVDGVNGWAGGFSDPTLLCTGGMWKYTGPNLSGATPPTAQFTIPPATCLGSMITTTNASVGNPVPSYSWSAPAGSVTFAPSPIATSPTLIFGGTGIYTIVCVATNSVGSNSTTQIINVQNCSGPTASFNMPPSTCANTLVITTNSSTGSPAPTYIWSTNPVAGVTYNPNNTAVSPTLAFSIPGTYSVMLMATSIAGSNATMQTFTVNPVPVLTIASTASILCAGNTATLTASGATSYTWSANAGGVTTTTAAVSPTVNTTYSITGVNSFGCSATKSFVQGVSPCLGITAISSSQEIFNLYPNPNNGAFTVKAESDIVLNITNDLGQLVKTIVLSESNGHQTMVNDLQNGIYFVYGNNNNIIVKQKVVVMK